VNDLSQRHRVFAAARQRAELTVQQLWLRYLALTGSCGVFEVDAFLHGLTVLPDAEQNILAHALNERLEDLYRDARVPYLGSDVSPAGPDDPLAVLHELLNGLLPSTASEAAPTTAPNQSGRDNNGSPESTNGPET
jgi:hypothetical protein